MHARLHIILRGDISLIERDGIPLIFHVFNHMRVRKKLFYMFSYHLLARAVLVFQHLFIDIGDFTVVVYAKQPRNAFQHHFHEIFIYRHFRSPHRK